MAAGYRPRAASNPLKHIVEDNLEELFGVWDERFLSTYGPLHPRLRELFSDDSNCQLSDIEEEDINQDAPAFD